MRHQSVVARKTVLDRFVFLSLAVLFFVSASAAFAAPNTLRETKTNKQPKQVNAKNPKALYKQIMLRIDEIEQRAPQCQTEIFGLRDDINQFYSFVVADLTDPVDKTGKPIVADLQKGNDMYENCEGLDDESLKRALLKLVNNHISVGYQRAQDLVFGDLDNRDGWVECVYTGRKLKTAGEPSATNMNIEHTWPQSKGAKGIAKCDLHHLFPADSKANGIRGNNPFGFVLRPSWEEGGSKTDRDVFEVRKEQRGNTARGMFYFAIRYNMHIDDAEEATLRKWHKEDPVDQNEKKRNDRVQNFQNNRNPFVDRPDFVDMISDF
jgi:deoxyribonuclease I